MSDFATFCEATHNWLATAPSLDPALAAAFDVLQHDLSERTLEARTIDAGDAHGLLGAQALHALWQARSTAAIFD